MVYRPDRALIEKGLRPAAQKLPPQFGCPDRALIEKGLRRHRARTLKMPCPDRALIDKGLRPDTLNTVVVCHSSGPRPDREGIKTPRFRDRPHPRSCPD